LPQRRPSPIGNNSLETASATKRQREQSSQSSQQPRQYGYQLSLSESDSSNVSTPETVRTSRVVGRRRGSAVITTGNRGTSTVPSRLNSSEGGQLEMALAMSQESANRDSRVFGSRTSTRVETTAGARDAAPSEQDRDLELALRLSLLGTCLEGMLATSVCYELIPNVKVCVWSRPTLLLLNLKNGFLVLASVILCRLEQVPTCKHCFSLLILVQFIGFLYSKL
jgi:hypothetical protein